jgi:hypothetical protein
MRFRFIRPLHGWREFIHEIVIVVIGVMLALAGAQVIENWRWQQQVGSARQSIGNELAQNGLQAATRLVVENCLRDRIGELATRLEGSGGRWKADPIPVGPNARPTPHWDNRSMGRVYTIPLVGWSQDAWDTAKSAGLIDHMSHEEAASYSEIYGAIAALRDYQNQELSAESSLAFLSTDEQLDSGSRNEALAKLGQLDALNTTVSGLSNLILEDMNGLHLHIDRARFSAQLKEGIADARASRGACVVDVHAEF